MGWRDWLRPWQGTAGIPPSGNGASSFHLFWQLPPGDWIAVEATLEILEPPTVDRLFFWALQANFTGDRRPGGAGGAHLGLQWCAPHPDQRAVNWGGYAADGTILDGSTSPLPSAQGNPHTRDFAWRAHVPYRLRISRDHAVAAPPAMTAWRGSVTDQLTGTTTIVRHLYTAGDRIDGAMVWSEVFASCDEPGVAVRWSEFTAESTESVESTRSDPTAVDGAFRVREATVNYQALSDGGCLTTDTSADAHGIVQRTGIAAHARTTAQGTSLRW